MNLSTLQTFQAIVETGSLVRASQKLNVTQSTITARLKLLEEDFGQTLLLRHKSGVKLTAPGYKFLRHAEVMLGIWQQAKQDVALPDGVNALCNIGCHMDLWPELGRPLFNEIYASRKQIALTVWPGEQAELDRWLGAGLADAVLTYQSTAHANQTVRALNTENLTLYSTRPDSPVRFDPNYVFVDYGEDFRQQHAEAYADADTAKIGFGCAVWAMDHLLENGGSAYLPERLASPHRRTSTLHALDNAPVFSRNTYLITNTIAAENWPWLSDLVAKLAMD